MMSLHKAIGSDPFPAFLLWSEAGVRELQQSLKWDSLCSQGGKPDPARGRVFPFKHLLEGTG